MRGFHTQDDLTYCCEDMRLETNARHSNNDLPGSNSEDSNFRDTDPTGFHLTCFTEYWV